MVALLTTAAVVCVVSAVLGQGVMRLSGERQWSWLSAAVGFAVLTRAVALPAALRAIGRPRRWGAGAWTAALVLLGALLPFAVNDRVGILGLSMGGLVGSEVAARAKPDFLITEGYPGDLPGVVAYQKAAFNKTVTLPAEVAAYPRVAARVRCPWRLIAGTQDKNTPLADSVAVVQAARRSQRRQLLAIDCGHLGAQEKLTETFFAEGYVRAIGRFLAG